MKTEEELEEVVALLKQLQPRMQKVPSAVTINCAIDIMDWILDKPSNFDRVFLDPARKILNEGSDSFHS